jgi:LysM repeat protein
MIAVSTGMYGGKSRFYLTVLTILTAHVVVIGAMLLQGCKDSPATRDQAKQDVSASTSADTTSAPATPPEEMPAPPDAKVSNTYAGGITSSVPAPQSTPLTGMAPTVKSAELASPPAPAQAKEYVIAKGDTLRAIARKNGTTVKRIMALNDLTTPSIRAGQKLKLPAPKTSTS